jgi:cytochrome P450 family 135
MELPPGPRLPAVLQSALVIGWPLPYLRACRKRYGDVFTVRTLFGGRTVMACGPQATRDVFTAPPGTLRAGAARRFLRPVLGSRSVLLLDGEEHLRQRRLLLPPFHGERMRAYAAVMEEATHAAIDRWPVGRPFRLLPEMRTLTLEVILRAVFGTQPGPREDELAAALRAIVEPAAGRTRLVLFALSGGRLGDPAGGRRFVARRERVDELLYAEIADRRADPALAEREDICALLLQARDEDDVPLRDEEVRDELMTLLVAGHETTATTAAWAFERVLRHPGVRRVLERELADGDESYLDAVIKETLRIRNVLVNVARVVDEPIEVGDHTIPPGVVVMPSISMIHRRPESWPAPLQFRPERFLDGGGEGYAWIPFGGGPRRCLGAAFAQFELKTVLRTVFARCDLEAVGRRAEPIRRNGITMIPGRGARVRQRRPPEPRGVIDAARGADAALA